MRAFYMNYVDHARTGMDPTEYTLRFGRDIVCRSSDFAPMEPTARFQYALHARKRVIRAHQPALKTSKVPRRSRDTSTLVSTPGIPHVDHVGARSVDFAVQRMRLRRQIERGPLTAPRMRAVRSFRRSRSPFTGHGSWSRGS